MFLITLGYFEIWLFRNKADNQYCKWAYNMIVDLPMSFISICQWAYPYNVCAPTLMLYLPVTMQSWRQICLQENLL